MSLNLQEKALFIADSHYNENRPELLLFLQKIQANEIKTTQLFLMGDMFDFISGESAYFIKQNQEIIHVLNELSHNVEIIYLEGNHDYNLKEIFPNIKVYSKEKQPVKVQYQDKSVALSHGDLYVSGMYDVYCKIIRNKPLLTFLNFIDFNHWLSKKIHFALLNKNICHKLSNFDEIVKKRINYYHEDIVIEGHYHQGKQFMFDNKHYINVPSLTCSKEYSCLNNAVFTNHFL